jgi:formate hydrogenlyase transcriptional activator
MAEWMENQPCAEESAEATAARYKALLEVSEAIALHGDLHALFHDLAVRLPSVLNFDSIGLVLHNPATDTVRLHLLETRGDSKWEREIPVVDLPVDQALSGLAWREQQSIVVFDTDKDTRAPQGAAVLSRNNIKSCSVVPLTTPYRRLGAMIFGSQRYNDYNCADLQFLEQVAKQVAVAVDNALRRQDAQRLQAELQHERDRLRLLLDLNNNMVSNLDLRAVLRAISASIRRVMDCDMVGVTLPDIANDRMRIFALDSPTDGNSMLREEFTVPMHQSISGKVFREGKAWHGRIADGVEPYHSLRSPLLADGFQFACMVPLISRGRAFGVLAMGRKQPPPFAQQDVDFLTQLSTQVAIAVENALEHREVTEVKERLANQTLYLQEEIRTEHNFEEIIGESAALKEALRQVETVAPTDSTVLILGETGTGKEVIARAIHNLSTRREQPFVKVNCAAIPLGLLESELFGHERGAFTGAIAQKIGRFELANHGTLFLDEVGDIPLELQPKLLRVLQEQEFERLGSVKTVKVDVRLIAATNANLVEMVEDRRFRADLYYRMNVFPIRVPPLRDRAGDIPLLVRYFTQKYARLMKKHVSSVPAEAMAALARYAWPGNIRELENLVERAVILSPGPELRIPLRELRAPPAVAASSNHVTTLEAAEREHILRALAETKWMIGGPTGAAARLGMKRTTLQSRMKNLGIARPK